MHPIVDLGLGDQHLLVTSYRLMLVVALVVVPLAALIVGHRIGLARRRFALVLGVSAVGAVIGARVVAVVLSRGDGEPALERLLHLGAGDFALYGGLALGGLVGAAAARAVGFDPRRAGDAVAPALGVGIVAMRFGCFLAGCCFGVTGDVPWAVTYPVGSAAHVHEITSGNPLLAVLNGPSAVHPVPLYEMAVAAAGVGLALLVMRSGAPAGAALAAFLAWYSGWRLLLQPMRAVSAASAPVWIWTALFAVVAVAAAGWLVRESGTRRGSLAA